MVSWFSTDRMVLIDVIIGFCTGSVVIGVCLYLHFRLYNEQRLKLDAQNAVLAEANRSKTEFLANTSHEMRTPLTVISVSVQTVMDILEDIEVEDKEVSELLGNAQSEIMRLARMVGGMLTLTSMSEGADRGVVDLSSLLQSGAEMLRLNLGAGGNLLETEIVTGLRVHGNADLLAQVESNLLTNAGAHTRNGVFKLSASSQGLEIAVSVRDDGLGVAPDLLPRVFERGVSDGGTGFGLYLCKSVIESHGGRIWIESESGLGTTVHFILPAYQGQFGKERGAA
jgi:signal transduction histidine kinase